MIKFTETVNSSFAMVLTMVICLSITASRLVTFDLDSVKSKAYLTKSESAGLKSEIYKLSESIDSANLLILDTRVEITENNIHIALDKISQEYKTDPGLEHRWLRREYIEIKDGWEDWLLLRYGSESGKETLTVWSHNLEDYKVTKINEKEKR